MNVIEISQREEFACSNDKFCSFVQQTNHSAKEINYLQTTILNKKLSRILYVSATLAVWSMVAAWIDLVILPVLIIYAISLPGAVYYPILFPIVWTILNATLKFVYIHKQLGNAVRLRDNLLAVFPYAGAAFLLKNWFVGDPLLRKVGLKYISYRKNQVAKKALSFFKRM